MSQGRTKGWESGPTCDGFIRVLRTSRPPARSNTCVRSVLHAYVCLEGSATFPSARRNEERRRAWRASRESRLQPLPSCEVW